METTEKVQQFFAQYPVRSYEKGQAVFRAGEAITDILYIEQGIIRQYDISSSGNEVVVNVFKVGAFFPMSAALNSPKNDYFYEATSIVQVRSAPIADVVAFLRANNDVTLDLLTRVYRGVDGVLRRMAHLMGGGAQSRLLFELINGSYRFGTFEPNGCVRLSLSEGDLAKASGLARETVNRELKKLKISGLVKVDSTGLVIPNLPKLEAQLGTAL